MLDELNPAECLAKTNTTFLVGDTINTLTGCNKLASLHFGSDVSSETEAKLMMGYFSSSVEELLSNMKNVPDIFADGTATHQCVEPEIRFTMHHDTEYPTIHTNPLLFMPGKAGFESIILNATRQFLRFDAGQFYIGESISAGLFDCKTVRYDWKIGDDIKNHTYNAAYPGNATKQLLKLNDSQAITNLSIVCVDVRESTEPWNRDLPSRSIVDSSHSLFQLITVFLAAFVVVFV